MTHTHSIPKGHNHGYTVGDLVRWTDHIVGIDYVGLYIGNVEKKLNCWEDIYLLVGYEKLSLIHI